MRRYRSLLAGVLCLVLIVMLTGASCGTSQGKLDAQTSAAIALITTGDSLRMLGINFETAAKGITAGCVAKTIAVKTCDAFRAFGTKFKESYPFATGLWESGRKFNDGLVQGGARDAMVALATELATFAVQAGITFDKPK